MIRACASAPSRGSGRRARPRPTILGLLVALLWCAPLLALVHATTVARAAANQRACDYYAAAATPCVAAHSTTRALFASYNGPLYAVRRTSDGTSTNIGLLAPGDYANAAAQDAFCANTSCIITIIYDQTANHNDLTIEGGGGAAHNPDAGAPADALPVTAGGHQVYGVSFSGRMGYRDDHAAGVATAGKPESMYMVTSGTHVNNLCCFDYGNAETSNTDTGAGHMDSVNFSTSCRSQANATQPDAKAWVKADLENGLFASDRGCRHDATDLVQTEPFVTALLKNNGQSAFTLKYGDAQSGALATGYAGPLPSGSYSPMHQEGAIVLGTGGDNSNGSIGSFFEGVMTAGYASDNTDDQVQADIVSVGYGDPTGLVGALQPGNEISLMTRAPNGSAYLLHQAGPSNDERIVAATIPSYAPVERLRRASWIVRRGFADNACLSFEARDLPGAFLRHDSDQLVVVPDDGSALFAADATFCPVAGLDGSGSSFQAADAQGEYIRVFDHHGFIASDGGPKPHDARDGWKTDVSFTVTPPLSP